MTSSGTVRVLVASAAIACAVALAGCETDGMQISEKHLKPVPAALVAEMERKEMSKESPILVRLFKQEAEFEVWKQDRNGRFALLKTYPICRWSGELGPKIKEGDRQAPEGFYTITPAQMNPKSQFHLAFNLGYPNAFDRAHGRTGAALMVHGDCSSSGCYAMTDEQVTEIYALGRESFFGGQRSFQVQAYPFRMNPLNMARHRNNPNMPFWKNLKQGYDHFEVTRQQPKVEVCEKRYVFDPRAKNFSSRLDFDPAGKCPAYEIPDEISSAVKDKSHKDEVATLDLIKRGTPALPIRTGQDGGMHPVFLASLKGPALTDADGNFRPFSVAAAPGTVPPHATPPKPASPVFATEPTYAPESATGSVAATDVPLPRAAPRKEASAATATFGARVGTLATTSASSSAAPAETKRAVLEPKPPASQSASRSAGADAKPAAAAKPTPPAAIAASADVKGQKRAAASKVTASPAPPQPIAASASKTRTTAAQPPASGGPAAAGGGFDQRWSAFR
ncbi:MAG TPA: L,D-transpeptidase family protein [Xanthobacteraceae bacterium]